MTIGKEGDTVAFKNMRKLREEVSKATGLQES
jgi:hypothetical protein